MATNKQIAENVLKAVGGKENVQQVTHCMTRLRFTLKDDTIPDKEEVKKISGVMSVVVSRRAVPGGDRSERTEGL